MNLLVIIGASFVITALVLAGLGIRLLAGRKTALRPGSCGSVPDSEGNITACHCGKDSQCE